MTLATETITANAVAQAAREARRQRWVTRITRVEGELSVLGLGFLVPILKMIGGDGITIGPILLGAASPVQVMTTTATVRRIVNLTALTAADAVSKAKQ